MHYHVTEFYKTPIGYYEGPIVITTVWEEARACAVERFFELYNDLCNQVGDRLITFVRIGNEPSQQVPLLAIREHLNDPAIIDRCANGELLVISMDGDDRVSIQLIQ
jgi:hypothetical protein